MTQRFVARPLVLAGLAAAPAMIVSWAPRPAAAVDPLALDANLQEIRTLVREKRYPLALESLRFIARQVQELRMEELLPLFPPPPEGWAASAPISLLDESEIWSNRIEASRSYRREKETSRVDVVLDLHSPLVPAAALGFNPLFVAGDPLARLIEIAGEKALVRFSADTGAGDLRIIIDRETLISLRGRGIPSVDTLADFARLMDFRALRARGSR